MLLTSYRDNKESSNTIQSCVTWAVLHKIDLKCWQKWSPFAPRTHFRHYDRLGTPPQISNMTRSSALFNREAAEPRCDCLLPAGRRWRTTPYDRFLLLRVVSDPMPRKFAYPKRSPMPGSMRKPFLSRQISIMLLHIENYSCSKIWKSAHAVRILDDRRV